MRLIIRLTLAIFLFVIPLCLFFLFSWGAPQDKKQSSNRLEWENLTVAIMSQYTREHNVVQVSENLSKEEYVVKSDLEELVDYAFKKGYLCNDEDKAMCIQKTEKLDDKTVKRLSVVTYFFLLGQKNHIYKIEFVDEKRTLISPDQDVFHNLVSQKDWEKYKKIEKFLVKQTIIRDGETILIAEPTIPLDGQPDFIFENTYVKTKDHILIHAEHNTSKADEYAAKMHKSYIKEMLEYMRNGYD